MREMCKALLEAFACTAGMAFGTVMGLVSAFLIWEKIF